MVFSNWALDNRIGVAASRLLMFDFWRKSAQVIFLWHVCFKALQNRTFLVWCRDPFLGQQQLLLP
jgi:hypothetical protein